MAKHKLTGSGGGKFLSDNRRVDAKYLSRDPYASGKKYKPLKGLRVTLILVLILEALYCLAIFSNIPFIRTLRDIYIDTAMSTMSHQWLATAFIPKDIIDTVVSRRDQAQEEQIGHNSSWNSRPNNTTPQPPKTFVNDDGQEVTVPDHENDNTLTEEQKAFFKVFWELDAESTLEYVDKHPEAVENGWEQLYINEAGLDDKGTSIKTIMGEQVLAIDAKSQVLVLRVTGTSMIGTSFRGVLAVAKNPADLHLYPSKNIGSWGEKAGSIASRHDGVLAMTGSAFIDEEGGGNGGTLAGPCVCDGTYYSADHTWGYKRIELREDNLMYLTDVTDSIGDDVTDAAEFSPALIIDGKVVVDDTTIWSSMNPRACIGQSESGEILMLVIEGRLAHSLGTDVVACADILKRHNGYQAMNLDGGTSAILWFDGEYITQCSNTALDEGRYLPNAWVYAPGSGEAEG